MTMYEPNPDVRPTGAEAEELVDTPHNEPGDHSEPDASDERDERRGSDDATDSRE